MTFPLRGGPDYGAPVQALAVAQIDPGLASEFAALGLSRIDSKGRPFLFDDFGGGLAGWDFNQVAGPGATLTAYGLLGYSAAQCCRFGSGVSGGAVISLRKRFQQPVSKVVGLEAAVYFEQASRPDFTIEVGGPSKSIILKYVSATGFWSVVAGAATVSLGLVATQNEWTVVKIIGDFSAQKYVAAIIGLPASSPVRTDLSSLNLANAVLGTYSLYYELAQSAAVDQSVDLGYSLFTIDEP